MAKKRGDVKINDVIQDLFNKKCYEFYTKSQLIIYLIEDLEYTPATAQRYYELMKQKMDSEIQYNYNDALQNMVAFLSNEIKTIDDKFLRIQYIKELNRIQNLGNKQQVDITSGGEPISYIINFTEVIKPTETNEEDETTGA